MKCSDTQIRSIRNSKALHMVVFVIAMISFTLHGANVRAANLGTTDYRLATASKKFENTSQFAVAFRMRPPRRLRARHVELAVGTISTSQETRVFVSLGPVWRLPINNRLPYVEFGFSPTLLTGSSLNGRDLGGNFHFTSSISIGATFGTRQNISLALRVQHMSNGGLNSTNPGLDMIGLNFAFNLSD